MIETLKPTNFVNVPVQRGKNIINALYKRIGFVYLAGGFARWACSTAENPVEFSDIDLAVSSEEHFKVVNNLLKAQYTFVTDTDNAVTYEAPALTTSSALDRSSYTFQLIKPSVFKGSSTEEIIIKIDFSVCRVGILDIDRAVASPYFQEDEKAKRLRIEYLDNIPGSFRRILKYLGKGYTIDDVNVLKLFETYRNLSEDSRRKFLAKIAENPNFDFSQMYSAKALPLCNGGLYL